MSQPSPDLDRFQLQLQYSKGWEKEFNFPTEDQATAFARSLGLDRNEYRVVDLTPGRPQQRNPS